MASNKKYWRSVEELNENSSIVDTLKSKEFVEEIPTDDFLGDKESLEKSSTTRRDFLKYVGFSTAAATLASCEGPVKKAIPYIVKPNQVIPGVADYYATAIADGFDFANILVKVREGRPIKIEPNKEIGGSTNARVQASVLSLYDSMRLQGSTNKGASISWSDVDAKMQQILNDVKTSGKEIAFLTSTHASPSTAKVMAEFSEKFGNVRQVTYDSISESAAIDAYAAIHGSRALPSYDFSKARTIVSIGADILGDWQGGGHDAGYAASRNPSNGKMSHHIQFESNMTLSGANADLRVPVKPSKQNLVLAEIYNAIVNNVSAKDKNVVNAVKQLKKGGNGAVVVTGIQTKEAQLLALAINNKLASQVIDVTITNNKRQGNDAEVSQLIADMKSGKIGVLFMNNTNPIYTLPNSKDFVDALGKVKTTVAFSTVENETTSKVDYVLATPHFLESWGTVEMKKGEISLIQPTIQQLFDTRQFEESLLKWSGNNTAYYNYIKDTFADFGANKSFGQALHDGSFTVSSEEIDTVITNGVDLAVAYQKVSSVKENAFELQLYTKTSLGDGQQANNPWLQELPDPITRTTWDNYITMSAVDAEVLGVTNDITSNGALNGSYITLKSGKVVLEKVPVIIQPGQAKGSIGLALGYGKKEGLKDEMKVGVDAFPIYKDFLTSQNVTVELASGTHHFASVQMQNTMVGRSEDIIRTTSLTVFNTKDQHAWNPVPEVPYDHSEITVRDENADLWDTFDTSIGHHFNLSIDLNACTGCGACVVACHAENNVPVVGKKEIRNFRDMHWLRVDRYYSSNDTFEKEIEDLENLPAFESYEKVELASQENPEVAFQPVMCQHCNHAPCESVCPVAATSHGRQGQNHMAYNRCVGTRYCANNCPYKVRRFNWFDYANNDEFDFNMNDDLGKMVLNPDVVVRSRGVMEKCSMCIQMTQASILKAKKEGRPVADSEFQTACSNACSTGAMVFGDVNDAESEVSKLKEDKRMYYLLENVGTQPNVFYHVKVKNTGV